MATAHSNTKATAQAWPSLAEFRALASTHRVIPVVRTVLADGHTALSLYQALAQNAPGTFLLESAHGGNNGRAGHSSACAALLS